MTKLKRGGGHCAICGTEIDRRATHCRSHHTGSLNSERATAYLRKYHHDTKRRAWLVDILLSLSHNATPTVNQAAILTVLLAPLGRKPGTRDPRRAVSAVATAYAKHHRPDANPDDIDTFAAAIEKLVTGHTDALPARELAVVATLLASPAAAALPPATLAQIVINALSAVCFGDSPDAALKHGMSAIADTNHT